MFARFVLVSHKPEGELEGLQTCGFYIPTVILVVEEGEARAAEAMEKGALLQALQQEEAALEVLLLSGVRGRGTASLKRK